MVKMDMKWSIHVYCINCSSVGAYMYMYLHWVHIFAWVLTHQKQYYIYVADRDAYVHGVPILYGCLLSRV